MKQLTGNTIIGIQGGKGSFNEVALLQYVQQKNIQNYTTKYLYTSQKVLAAVDSGEVDLGVFAVHNSVGGAVTESMHAMADFTFTIKDEVQLLVRHMLMKRRDVNRSQIKHVLTHPQVIKQCIDSLKKRLPELIISSGQGDLIDHAEVARQLAAGKIDAHTGVIGPAVLAELYDLEIIEADLQDNPKNWTHFFVVEK